VANRFHEGARSGQRHLAGLAGAVDGSWCSVGSPRGLDRHGRRRPVL